MKGLLVPVLAVLYAVAAAGGSYPSADEAFEPLRQELVELTGSDGTVCGNVRLRASPDEAFSCADKQLHENSPFWVAVQLQGTDSYLWVALARSKRGDLMILHYDSNVHGQREIKPSIKRSSCNAPTFRQGPVPNILCAAADGA